MININLCYKNRKYLHHSILVSLADVWAQVLLDSEEEGGVPRVQPGDGVILLHCLGEGICVLVINLLKIEIASFSIY